MDDDEYETEWRVNAFGIKQYAVMEDGSELVLDEWSCLLGLVKCTSYPLEAREEMARGMAETWAEHLHEFTEIQA